MRARYKAHSEADVGIVGYKLKKKTSHKNQK